MSLPRRFSISINGRPIGMPRSNPDEPTQAKACDMGDEPAVFEIQDRHLVSGPFAMGRHCVEDLSLRPKRVLWCPREQMGMLRPVDVLDKGNGPELGLSGGKLAYDNGQLVCPLIPGGEEQRVEILPM
ncbi:hypothetical protein HYE68_001880 [Fusarium pseudograminearum]|nr:hypothetical protein HYE68_001880 [Fusarium pseudograminearum]